MREAPLGLLFGAVLLGAVASTASAQEITWAGGLDLANGDYYFSERTTALWLTNGVVLRSGVFWFDASLPVLLQNSDAVTRVGGLPVPEGSTSMIDDVAGPVSTGGDLSFWSDGGSSLRAGLRFGLAESAADVAVTLGWAVPLTS